MPLTLSLTAPSATPGVEPSKSLSRGALSIGRGPEGADWVLPDDDKILSKLHCRIDVAPDGEFMVTDLSTNGLFVNGAAEPLGKGRSTPLKDGDRLALGGYEIAVSVDAASDPASPRAGTAAPPTHEPHSDDDPFGAGVGHGNHGPFAGRKPAPSAALPPDADDAPFDAPPGRPGAMEQAPFAVPPSTAPEHAVIPDDVDFLGELGVPGGAPQDEPARYRGSMPDDVPSVSENFTPPRLVPEEIPENWDSMEPTRPPTAPPHPVTPAPAFQPSSAAPDPAPTAAESGRPAVPPAATTASAADSALLVAFLAGAGIDPGRVTGVDASEFMRGLGELFVVMVAGLRETLAARAAIKNEFRIERTTLAAANNNPLKFSASVEEALLGVLLPQRPGYMAPAEAVQGAFDDLKAHEVAMMAGMQAALRALLDHLDPDAVQNRAEQKSALASLLPAARKAQYWEIYEALYREIVRNAEDRFGGPYASEFVRAYEKQIDRL